MGARGRAGCSPDSECTPPGQDFIRLISPGNSGRLRGFAILSRSHRSTRRLSHLQFRCVTGSAGMNHVANRNRSLGAPVALLRLTKRRLDLDAGRCAVQTALKLVVWRRTKGACGDRHPSARRCRGIRRVRYLSGGSESDRPGHRLAHRASEADLPLFSSGDEPTNPAGPRQYPSRFPSEHRRLRDGARL